MEEHPSPVPCTAGGRVLYGLVAVILPAVCFLLGDFLRPEWQSGLPSAYASILLGPQVTLFFVPFLVYAVVCLVLLLIAPRRFARFFAVRLGIYGGVLLALQYAVLLGLAVSGEKVVFAILGGLFLCAVPPAIAWAYSIAQRKFGSKTIRWVTLISVTIVAIVIAVTSLFSYGAPLTLIVMLLLAGAPFWCLDIAVMVSFRLLRDYELQGRPSLWHIVGPLTWLGALGTAWRFAVVRMWEVYATLPPQPPECYVATAAANGHPRVVRSWPATARDGRTFRVNRQLQRLKLAELALQATCPPGHRLLRRVYDALGPRLARRLHPPLLADAAYLLLKPAEWGTWVVLHAFFPQAVRLAGWFYTAKSNAQSKIGTQVAQMNTDSEDS
jgi:hypothetical protein